MVRRKGGMESGDQLRVDRLLRDPHPHPHPVPVVDAWDEFAPCDDVFTRATDGTDRKQQAMQFSWDSLNRPE
jgi:hypothetical protein